MGGVCAPALLEARHAAAINPNADLVLRINPRSPVAPDCRAAPARAAQA